MKITKEQIQMQIGCEVKDIKLEPIYKDGECVGLNVFVTPARGVQHIELDFKVLPTGADPFDDI